LFNIITTPDIMPILSAGGHDSPAEGACVMEYQALLAGEPFSDNPQCVDEALCGWMISVNDTMADQDRHRLVPFLGRAIGLVAPGKPPIGEMTYHFAFGTQRPRLNGPAGKALRDEIDKCLRCSYVQLCDDHVSEIREAVRAKNLVKGMDLLHERVIKAKQKYALQAKKLRTLVLVKLADFLGTKPVWESTQLPVNAMEWNGWFHSNLEDWANERGLDHECMVDEVVDRAIEMTEAVHKAYEEAMAEFGWEVKR
jgi:hypothetical protein